MIHDLTPYPAMKDSGVPWLGPVPEHWDIQRGKKLFRVVDIRSRQGTEELLTVSSERGVIPRSTAKVTMFQAESYKGHKLCWPDDLVINSLWAWSRGLGVAQHHGIISTAYSVYRIKDKEEVLPAFINSLVRSSPFQWELQVRSKGVWISRLQLTDDSFLDAPFPLPSPDEQAAIVRFLDHADRRIRRTIAAKQRLIKLLQEQKQVIIHQAVTRGLDPNVKLKPSGVEWLGDVPEGWEVVPLHRLSSARCDGPFGSNLKSVHYVEEGLRVVRLQNIGHGEFKGGSAAYISEAHGGTLGDHWVKEGDLLIAGLGDDRHPAGRACVAPQGIEPAIVKADCFRFRLFRQRVLPEFAALQLTATSKSAGAVLSTGSTRQRTNLLTTGGKVLALPKVAIQERIMESLQAGLAPLKLAEERAQQEIALLREYRTRLIADVVTGKLDVRGAAALLPELGAEALPDEVQADVDELDADEAEVEEGVEA